MTAVRAHAAAVFAGAAALSAAAHAVWMAFGPVAGGAPPAQALRVTFLSAALFAVPAAAAVGALAAPRLGGPGLQRAAAVAAGAYAFGALVVLLVSLRPGGFFGPGAAFGPCALNVGPALALRAALSDGLVGLLLPALLFGSAAGWALRRRAAT